MRHNRFTIDEETKFTTRSCGVDVVRELRLTRILCNYIRSSKTGVAIKEIQRRDKISITSLALSPVLSSVSRLRAVRFSFFSPRNAYVFQEGDVREWIGSVRSRSSFIGFLWDEQCHARK